MDGRILNATKSMVCLDRLMKVGQNTPETGAAQDGHPGENHGGFQAQGSAHVLVITRRSQSGHLPRTASRL
jgi:hypothetical protein